MREVAIVSHAQSQSYADAGALNEVELIMPVLEEAKSAAGLELKDIDFTCSGSCDYLQGMAFAFVEGVDAIGAVPPIRESHVEMDAAWALFEAWLKIQMGHADTALIYGFSKASGGQLPLVMSLQLDPYYLAPLWADSISLAALQARSMLDQGLITEREMAETVARSRAAAMDNPKAQLKGEFTAEQLLAEETLVAPLRRHDCAPLSDGASAMVLAVREVAEKLCERPAYIRAIEHRMESSCLGARELVRSPSTAVSAQSAGVGRDKVDLAEVYAAFSHQEKILRQALGLDEKVLLNPSGGALAGNVMMAAGLDRIGEVAMRIAAGEGDRGVAHASSGPCLQHNMVVVLEGA